MSKNEYEYIDETSSNLIAPLQALPMDGIPLFPPRGVTFREFSETKSLYMKLQGLKSRFTRDDKSFSQHELFHMILGMLPIVPSDHNSAIERLMDRLNWNWRSDDKSLSYNLAAALEGAYKEPCKYPLLAELIPVRGSYGYIIEPRTQEKQELKVKLLYYVELLEINEELYSDIRRVLNYLGKLTHIKFIDGYAQIEAERFWGVNEIQSIIMTIIKAKEEILQAKFLKKKLKKALMNIYRYSARTMAARYRLSAVDSDIRDTELIAAYLGVDESLVVEWVADIADVTLPLDEFKTLLATRES